MTCNGRVGKLRGETSGLFRWKKLADESIRFADEFGFQPLTKSRVFFSGLGGNTAQRDDSEQRNCPFFADFFVMESIFGTIIPIPGLIVSLPGILSGARSRVEGKRH